MNCYYQMTIDETTGKRRIQVDQEPEENTRIKVGKIVYWMGLVILEIN